MKLSQRFSHAWSVLTGKRDTYVGVYGQGPRSSGFAGGAVNRLTSSLATWSASANSDLDGPLPILRARARALAANNEHGRRFLSLVGTNIVGRNNPQLQVRAYFQSGPKQEQTLDKAANDAIETHWQRWGKTADITGHHKSLSALWRMVAKGVARDGEALVRLIRNQALPYGFALQALEADRLDENINARLTNGNAIRQGVEIDSTGRAVAYHIRSHHPGENYIGGTPAVERVPAQDIIHVFLQERAEQVRGVTWFHAVIIRGSIIHRFEDAAVTAAEIGASKIATLEASVDSVTGGEIGAGLGDRSSDGTAGGIPQISTEPGEMIDLTNYPGVTMNSWNPDYPHQNFESFLKACLRGLAAGLDVAAHNLTGDMTDVNYSSARIAELNEREVWMTLQDWFIGNLVEPVYSEWLAIALLRGDIRFDSSGKALPAERLDKFATASRFMGRRWAWVDPAKEMEANQGGVQLGVTSRTRIAAEQGIDIEDVIDEQAQERKLMQAAGLSLDVKPGTPPPPPPPPAPAKPTPPDPNLAKAMALMLARAAEPREQRPAPNIHVPVSVAVDTAEMTRAADSINSMADTMNAAMRDMADGIREDIKNMPIVIPAPIVNIAATQITNEINVEPTPVTMEATIQPAEVTLNLPARRTDTQMEYNQSGEIVRATQIETDV